MLIKEVFSHRAMCLRCSDAGQTANIVAQLLDGVMAVSEEVLLEEVTHLQKNVMTIVSKMENNAIIGGQRGSKLGQNRSYLKD